MISRLSGLARKDPQLTAAGIVAVIGTLTIGGFFFFQFVMDLPPCPICLEERDAFYVCVPLAALLLLGLNHSASSKVMIAGFAVIAAFMLWNAGLGAYHAGIEWKFWPGPQDCSGPIDKFGAARDILKSLQHISLVRCDEAAWRFLGLSLAGWNVLVSLGLACVAGWGALAVLALQKRSG
ncbi:MAG TPA: disulfide bond formation protein B [Pseudolabrys sp.]|jgi:disulfide bond formation protein DsbB